MKFIVLADKKYLFERFEPFRFFRTITPKDNNANWKLFSLIPIFYEKEIPVYKYI